MPSSNFARTTKHMLMWIVGIFVVVAIVLGLFFANSQQNTTVATIGMDSKITYFRDSRTNLCFASVNSRSYGFYVVTSITWVPTTPEVLTLIEKQERNSK